MLGHRCPIVVKGLNCFHSYGTLNKLKKHERVCNKYDYCHVDMPKEHEKIKYPEKSH